MIAEKEMMEITNGVDNPPKYHASLIECCYCRNLQEQDPVMLECLHSCCQSCLEQAAVKCPECHEITEPGSVMPNGFLSAYRRSSAIFSDSVYCKTCEQQMVLAEFWCVDCCMGMCRICYEQHGRLTRHRCGEALDVVRSWPLKKRTPAAQCSLHRREITEHCFTCLEPKCSICCEWCRAEGHSLQSLSHEDTQIVMSKAYDAVKSSREQLVDGVLQPLLQKNKTIASRLQELRDDGRRTLGSRRKLLYESTEYALNKSLDETRAGFQGAGSEFPDATARAVATSCEADVKPLSRCTVQTMQYLYKKCQLKEMAHCRIFFVRALATKRFRLWKASDPLGVDGSVSVTADITLSAFFVVADRRRAAQLAPLQFHQVPVSFSTPERSWDLAVTRDGHVLLPAQDHGLFEYDNRGSVLRTWIPPRQGDGYLDGVVCTTALTDGRVAAGLFWASLVVILTPSDEGSTWLESQRLSLQLSHAWRLAVYSDLLAVVEMQQCGQQPTDWGPGRRLQLIRLSSEQVCYTQLRSYMVRSVALTALCVVTASCRPVKRDDRPEAYSIDAYSHSGKFLWQYEANVDEFVWGVCTAESWSNVYALAMKKDLSSRVAVLGGADGKEKADVLSSRTHGLLLPICLSLGVGQQRTVLAVATWDKTDGQVAKFPKKTNVRRTMSGSQGPRSTR